MSNLNGTRFVAALLVAVVIAATVARCAEDSNTTVAAPPPLSLTQAAAAASTNPPSPPTVSDAATTSPSLRNLATAIDLQRVTFVEWSAMSADDIATIPAVAFRASTLYEASLVSDALRNVSLSCGVLQSCCSGFTSEQLAAIPVESFTGFSALCVKGFRAEALRAVDADRLFALPSIAIVSWSKEQLAAIAPEAFGRLSARQAVDFVSTPERRAKFCPAFSAASASKVSNVNIVLYIMHACGEDARPDTARVAFGRICLMCEYRSFVPECKSLQLTADAQKRLTEECKEADAKFHSEAEALAAVSAAAAQRLRPTAVSGPTEAVVHHAATAATSVIGTTRHEPVPTWHRSAFATPPGVPNISRQDNHVNSLFGGNGSIAILLVILTGLVAYAGYVHRQRNRHQVFGSPTSDGAPSFASTNGWTPIGSAKRSKPRKGTRGGVGVESAGIVSYNQGGYGGLQDGADI